VLSIRFDKPDSGALGGCKQGAVAAAAAAAAAAAEMEGKTDTYIRERGGEERLTSTEYRKQAVAGKKKSRPI
jgi:hypothetical protein